MPSPSAILRLACFAFLPLAVLGRTVRPYMLPRDANTTSDGLIHPKQLTFSVNCSISDHDYGHGNGVLEGFHYLMSRGGMPGNNPGSCGRISCSHDTGIHWCNEDKTKRKALESYQVIARAVMEIFQQKPCWQNFDDDNFMGAGIKGKALVDGEDWSVWVAHEDCSAAPV
ncbi:hypothetical protein NEUTE1DRAFT_128944 [Neurospora tetrasperma FGSC 2508]|uniref:Ecp2 effector protein domain-containing protein n=1 Tax=Neurospora tetrasperma (strain FGSC 2508 / ATCC MYA-4615 / P0657) TaxID=510951 RepID=F8MHE1_NEUT8|nr:uncharacterized protein NEUTE1DRAFT_128944 [Neurospora tetrasperma FGSC 2508]EGO59604.1 hypothetical protein NEUTE1DRAFT_128944 [Neurospora tetrasperma FGSC 2508]EGZ73732.1 hypothetical protein NEUTE2DRAFT_108630 [Neurospora tetrasperma FGSC 2509]